MKPGFRLFPHTADMGLYVYGTSLPDLFENAACGMTRLLYRSIKTKKEKKFSVRLTALDLESLLVDWLREVHYLVTVKKKIFSKFKLKELTSTRLTGAVYGHPFDPKNDRILREIKAVTYHGLNILKTRKGYRASVIFDV